MESELSVAVGVAARSRSPSTRRAYESAWNEFGAWCAERGLGHLPASGSTVAVWLASLFGDGLKPSTVSVKAAAVAYFHGRAKSSDGAPLPNPCGSVEVRDTLAGIRNTAADRGERPRRAEPVTVDRLAAALALIDRSEPRGRRDAALLLLGFSSALRRSEIAALTFADVQREPNGLIVRVARSKGDQGGRGQAVGVPFGSRRDICPAAALDAWIADLLAAGFDHGPIFREVHRSGSIPDKRDGREAEAMDPESLNRIVRARLAAAGMEGRRPMD